MTARVRPWLPLLLLLAVLVGAVALAGPGQSGGPPLDPRSPIVVGLYPMRPIPRS